MSSYVLDGGLLGRSTRCSSVLLGSDRESYVDEVGLVVRQLVSELESVPDGVSVDTVTELEERQAVTRATNSEPRRTTTSGSSSLDSLLGLVEPEQPLGALSVAMTGELVPSGVHCSTEVSTTEQESNLE